MCAKMYVQGGLVRNMVSNFSHSQKAHKEERVQIIVLLGGKTSIYGNDNREGFLCAFVFVKKEKLKRLKEYILHLDFYNKDGH